MGSASSSPTKTNQTGILSPSRFRSDSGPSKKYPVPVFGGCCGGRSHAVLRLRISDSELAEIRNVASGGWKWTGLSKRVINTLAGWFIITTAALAFTRTTRQSRLFMRMTSPARSRNGWLNGRQIRAKSSVWAGFGMKRGFMGGVSL